MAQAWTLDRNEGGSKKYPFVAHILSLTPRYSQLPPSFTPDRSACGGNRERSCWGSETVGGGGGVGMTATAGAVAVLRTCEPWTSLFHMALACRVTRNTVMMAVIAHPAVWPPTPTPAAHLREKRMGEPVSKTLTLAMAKTQTFMTRTDQTFLSMFWQHITHIHLHLCPVCL